MPLVRVTSVLLIAGGILFLAIGIIHSWAGLDFFDVDTRAALAEWWTMFVVMFYGAGFGLMLAGGILIHAGAAFRRRMGAALIPAVMATLFLMLVSGLVVFTSPEEVISWIIAGVCLVVIVALVFGFAAVSAMRNRKDRA